MKKFESFWREASLRAIWKTFVYLEDDDGTSGSFVRDENVTEARVWCLSQCLRSSNTKSLICSRDSPSMPRSLSPGAFLSSRALADSRESLPCKSDRLQWERRNDEDRSQLSSFWIVAARRDQMTCHFQPFYAGYFFYNLPSRVQWPIRCQVKLCWKWLSIAKLKASRLTSDFEIFWREAALSAPLRSAILSNI